MSNIVQVPAAPSNYTISRLGYKVNGMIIHTMVGTLASCDATFRNVARGASAHHGVACDGSVIHQYVGEQNIAWHCGRFYPDAAHPLANANTIGVEHCDDGHPFSPRQNGLYVASAQLIREERARWGFSIDRTHIRRHNEVSVLPTGCPDSLDIELLVRMAAGNIVPDPAPGEDDDMLYAGPFHAKPATIKVFAAGKSYLDPSTKARAGGALAVGAAVVVDGYRYSDSPVTSPDLDPAAGNQPGPDYVWWHAKDSGQWVPDAYLDTSALAGAPTAALPAGETLSNYFLVVGGAAPLPDLSGYATKTELGAVEAKIPTKATGNVSLTLGK